MMRLLCNQWNMKGIVHYELMEHRKILIADVLFCFCWNMKGIGYYKLMEYRRYL